MCKDNCKGCKGCKKGELNVVAAGTGNESMFTQKDKPQLPQLKPAKPLEFAKADIPKDITRDFSQHMYVQMLDRKVEEPVSHFVCKIFDQYISTYGKLAITQPTDITMFLMFFYGCYAGDLSVAVTTKIFHECITKNGDLTLFRNVPF